MNFNILNKNINMNILYKTIKIWIILFLIITIILGYYSYCINEYLPINYNLNKISFLRKNTSSYPPPLINFFDPPDVFTIKMPN
jgi:hypothetical protein